MWHVSENVIAGESRALSAAYSFDNSSGYSLSSVTLYLCYEAMMGENMTCTTSLERESNATSELGFTWLPNQITLDMLGTTSLRNYSGPLMVSLGSVPGTTGSNPSIVTVTYVEYFQDTYRFGMSRLDHNNLDYGSKYHSVH